MLRKLSILFLLLYYTISQKGWAQDLNKPITINANNQTLNQIIATISKAAKVDFAYRSNILPQNKLLSIKETNKPLAYILGALLVPNSLDYKVMNNQIIIIPKNERVQLTKPNIEYRTLIQKVTDTIEIVKYDTLQIVKQEFVTRIDTSYVEIIKYIDDDKTYHKSLNLDFSPYTMLWINYKGNTGYQSNTEPAYNFNLIFNYYFTQSFYVSTGIGFASTTEKIKYNYQYSQTTAQTYLDTIDIINQEIDGKIVEIPIIEEKIKNIITTQETFNTHTNRLFFLNIPFTIGYTTRLWHKKIQLQIAVGTMTNFVIRADEKKLDNNQLQAVQGTNYRGLTLAMLGKLQIQYIVNKRIRLLTGSTYNHALNTLYKTNIQPNKQFNSLLFSMGIEYFF